MSAYSRAFQALTSGRPLHPGDAAQLLADLRREFGEGLADAVERDLDGQFRRTDTDTDGAFRKKKRIFAASMRALNAVRALARTSHPTLPHQRDNRSTS